MFARKNRKTIAQRLALLGALAFTMSTLPGFQNASETTNASEVAIPECSDSVMRRGNSPECVINGSGDQSNLQGKVSVRLVEGVLERDSKDPRKFNTTDEFEVTLRTFCKTQKEDCTEKTTVMPVPLSEHRTLISKAKEQFVADAKALSEKAAADKARRQDEFDCKIDAEGKKVQNIPACRIVQIRRLKDEGKEAAYFEANVLPEIKNLLAKTDPASQQKGMNLLKAYAEAGLQNEYITQTIETHRQFGFYNRQAVQETRAINDMARTNPFSPQVQYARQMAIAHQREAQNYFYQRGLEVPSTWEVSGYDLGGYMQNNLSSMRQIVNDHYAMTLNQYQNGVNQQLMNNLTGNVNGTQPAVNPQLQRNQMQAPQQWNGLPMPQQTMRTVGINQQGNAQQGARAINPRSSVGTVRAPPR